MSAPMSTAPVTRALRKSGLPERKVIGRTPTRKPITQQGWYLTKGDGCVVVAHSALNWETDREFTHAERTTPNYAEFMIWLESVKAALSDAGLTVEVEYGQRYFGLFSKSTATVVTNIKVVM